MNARTAMAVVAMIMALLSGIAPARAQSNCANLGAITITSSPLVSVPTAYDPFGTGDLTFTFQFLVRNGNGGNCTIRIGYVRPTGPAAMTNTTFGLNYGLEATSGVNVLNIGAPPPAAAYQGTLGGGVTGAGTVVLRIPQSQLTAAAGTYQDTNVVLYAYGWRNATGSFQLATSQPVTFRATINSTCTMAAASPSTLNFTSAVSSGVPNPAVVLSSTLSSINCTAPATVTLAGAAMQRTPVGGTASGFDNFINWRAAASFGSASAILQTNSASSVTSTGTNVASGTTVGGSFGVNVNLLAGQHVLPGTYGSVLTVTVTPQP